ncbi:MAG TPA: competence protein ComEA, partial [Candidatus Cloacimonadota bacterium]|nr:competence protein ComEA [Candidatus Cloacimonadota bacterium]
MNNRIHNLLSSSEQRLILFVGIIALFGYTLDLLAFRGAEFKAAAADSLAATLEEDEALVIDIRLANAEELMCLPGIGP